MLLAQAIVAEQIKDYYKSYIKAHNNKSTNAKYYLNRLIVMRNELINYSFASYLDLDMGVVLNEVEHRARNNEDIRWSKTTKAIWS